MLIRLSASWPSPEVIAATEQVVEPGATVEVDDALGAALCEQVDKWQPVKPAKPKPEEA